MFHAKQKGETMSNGIVVPGVRVVDLLASMNRSRVLNTGLIGMYEKALAAVVAFVEAPLRCEGCESGAPVVGGFEW
jgi:hypothetical protein